MLFSYLKGYENTRDRNIPFNGKKKGDEEKMKLKDIINNPVLKSVAKYAGVAVAGIAAVSGALSDQKREKEFEDLKKQVADLQKK